MSKRFASSCEMSLSFLDLEVLDSEIYDYLGYRDSTPNEDVAAIIEQLLSEVSMVCKPRCGYREVCGRVENSMLYLDGVEFDPMPIITHQLRKGEKFVILVGTVGAEMDQWIHNYRVDSDIMKAYVADGLGSVIAEAIVAYGAKYLEALYSGEGMHISNSYSPGYCGWNVIEQHKLFSLLPEQFCGITLCESSLMLPIKSVSSVIAVGVDVVKRDYGCAICNKQDCYKRRL